MISKYIVLGMLVSLPVSYASAACPGFATPPSSRIVIVAQDMVVNGVPMSASELHSKQSPNEVLQFYRREWEARSQRVLETSEGGWRTIATKDGNCFLTVQIKSGSQSETYALLGTTQLVSGAVKVRGDGFPKLGGSTVYNDIVSKDLGKTGRTILMANNFSIDANANFYRNAMSGDGWVSISERPARTENGMRHIQIWRRGLEEANVVIGKSAEMTSVIANVVDRP